MTVIAALGLSWLLLRRRRPRARPIPIRVVLLIVLIEVRSGRSVLAALTAASARLPQHRELARAARLATVAGLPAAVSAAGRELRPVIAQLARAQRSGAPLADTVRRLIDDDLAEERARRLARARSLPARLMVPVTLLQLPGLVLLLYAPSLLSVFEGLIGGLP
ncbi:MAG: type II secretion system F family protein [Actinomycetes bacterium]|jgi:hypothetical protein